MSDYLPVGLCIIDMDGNVVAINKRLREIVGGKEPIRAMEFGLLRARVLNQETSPGIDEMSMLDALKGEHCGRELEIAGPNGIKVTVLASAKEVLTTGGTKISIAVLQDISRMKKTERLMTEQAQALSRSNEDLEQFAYVASHDLREPLRMISNYLGLLQRNYAGSLDAKAEKYIDFAVNGSIRMQQLIDDLLTYSRIGREENLSRVNLDKVIESCLGRLRILIMDNNASVTHDPMPTLESDETQMIQLFQNLIENGIKYRGDEPPVIHVGATRVGRTWTFSVKDNGIGIDPNYHDRIFQLFQRLHNGKNLGGTGIGLATAKKIVERNGGRIWVESELGKGSTFYFTLRSRHGDRS